MLFIQKVLKSVFFCINLHLFATNWLLQTTVHHAYKQKLIITPCSNSFTPLYSFQIKFPNHPLLFSKNNWFSCDLNTVLLSDTIASGHSLLKLMFAYSSYILLLPFSAKSRTTALDVLQLNATI